MVVHRITDFLTMHKIYINKLSFVSILYKGGNKMENDKSQKLGVGIITVSVLHLIGAIFSILGLIILLVFRNSIQGVFNQTGQKAASLALSTNHIIVSLVLTLILSAAVILILLKKASGIYAYFICSIINIIYSIVLNGFKWTSILSVILPILMLIFITRKKEVFGFKSKTSI